MDEQLKSDRELTIMLQSGDEAEQNMAFAALMRRYTNPLRNFIKARRPFTNADVDDVVQETFARLWQNRKRLDPDYEPGKGRETGNLGLLLHTIAANYFREIIRQNTLGPEKAGPAEATAAKRRRRQDTTPPKSAVAYELRGKTRQAEVPASQIGIQVLDVQDPRAKDPRDAQLDEVFGAVERRVEGSTRSGSVQRRVANMLISRARNDELTPVGAGYALSAADIEAELAMTKSAAKTALQHVKRHLMADKRLQKLR